jgi:predicted metal-dependent peptidase
MSLTIEQILQKCSLAILTHDKYRGLGGVLMMGESTVVDDLPTAATDGLNTEYGREFMASLTEPEIRFVILHETLHKAFRHLTTWRWMWKENPRKANAACDYVINITLTDADAGEGFIKMPEIGFRDEKYRGMDAGEVYRLLKDEDGGGCGKGFDAHNWEKAVDRTEQEIKSIEKTVTEALQQGGMIAGKLGGAVDRMIKDSLAPKVNWPDELRDFVTSLCSGRDISTWRRPNRRLLADGIYMPSTISETVGRLGIGVDTSGSVGNDELRRFLSEVCAVATTVKPELVDLLYWDGHVAAHEKYAAGQYEMLMQTTKPKGGGGTSPSCVTNYLTANRIRPECFIMLSDGYVGNDWGGVWPCPVLWCLTTKRIVAGSGKTLYIGD